MNSSEWPFTALDPRWLLMWSFTLALNEMATCSNACLMAVGRQSFAASPVTEPLCLLPVVSCHGYNTSDTSLVWWKAIKYYTMKLWPVLSSCVLWVWEVMIILLIGAFYFALLLLHWCYTLKSLHILGHTTRYLKKKSCIKPFITCCYLTQHQLMSTSLKMEKMNLVVGENWGFQTSLPRSVVSAWG